MTRYLVACLAGALSMALAPRPGALRAQERVRDRAERDNAPTLPRDVARDVVELYNAPGTMRVVGAFEVGVERDIDGDVAVLGGPVTVAGRVRGQLLAINADVTFRPGARVDGDVRVVGGIVDGRQQATLDGELRIYRQPLRYRLEGESLVAERADYPADWRPWWRRRDRDFRRTYASLSLTTAKTYNRVEGLPIHFGPTLTHDFGAGRLRLDAYGIFRTAGEFSWDSANVGHLVRAELRLGRGSGIRLGGRLFDEVDAVEDWQLGDVETGLASFFAHRDYRDYFDRHGAAAYVTLAASADVDLTASFSDQRWGARQVRDPWTLFRNAAAWRPNPRVDEGRVHVSNATLRVDTRNDEDNPWSGWYVVADYEYGVGRFTSFGPVSADVAGGVPLPGARDVTPGRREYGRAFLDLRRYNRLSPEARLDMRVVGGGWTHGDPLPLQRRFSVTGPGAMPGFDFRRPVSLDDDVGQCSVGGVEPNGSPAQCERFAMAQVELRGDLRINLFDGGPDDDGWVPWDANIDLDGSWVVFADAGRGWLVGDRAGDLVYPRDALPRLGTFLTDLGVGLEFGGRSWGDTGAVGIYVAKSVSRPAQPANFFLRVRRRF